MAAALIATLALALPTYDDFESYDPPAYTDHGIVCGDCTDASYGGDTRRHASVAEVRRCWAWREADAAEAAAEKWAEDAWLRHAEAGTPDTWHAEDLERQAEAAGLPIPPGMH